jgi:hypothetical protein
MMANETDTQIERVPNRSAGELAGFDNGGQDPLAEHAGTRALVAREESESKAALFLARQFPRNEVDSYNRAMKSAQRPAFAETCVYAFPRGSTTVEGPSVDLARELARCWGNVRYGLRVVTEDEERIHIKGFAWDLESNNYVEAEDKFQKLIQRKQGRGPGAATIWVKPDERDLRELVNRRGAICVRNAILQLMPPDIVDEMLNKAKETTRRAARGEIEQDRDSAVRRMAAAFNQLGVTTQMIAEKLGHELSLIDGAELAELRAIYKSLSDGNSRRHEHFGIPGVAPTGGQTEPQDRADELAKKIAPKGGGSRKGRAPAKKPEPEPEPEQSPAVANSNGLMICANPDCEYRRPWHMHIMGTTCPTCDQQGTAAPEGADET